MNQSSLQKSSTNNKIQKLHVALLSKLVFMSLALLGYSSVFGQTFSFNGLNYNLDFSTIPTSAEVAQNPGSTGFVVIPSTVIYNGDEYEVKSIGIAAFLNCSGLTDILIPNSVENIKGNSFLGCTALTSVTIPNSVLSIGNSAFAECTGLVSIDLSIALTSLAFGVFTNCQSLSSINLPNSIVAMGSNTFSGCTNLSTVNIPNQLTALPGFTFSNCSSLATVQIPSTIASIGMFAFANCSSLSNINIPSAVASFGDFAFGNCHGLNSVTVNWATPLSINDQIFFDVNLGNVSLNVPFGTQNLYQNAAIWEEFNPIIEQAPACVTAQGTDVISSCGPITWIDGNTYTSSNYSATHLLVGAAQGGCDSLVTLNLTVWGCTQLNTTSCNAMNVTMNETTLRANNMNAPAYRFRIIGANNAGPGWNANTFILDRPSRDFKFSQVPGSLWGETYIVDVAVGDGNGNWSPYGTACSVYMLANIPTTQLVANNCNSINVDPNINLLATAVNSATGYRFRVNGVGVAANTIIEKTMGGGAMRKLKMNEVAGIIQGETYTIEIAVRDALGNWGAYGASCSVTLAGSQQVVINNDHEMIQTRDLSAVEFGVSTSHNPFTTDFGLQVLQANDVEFILVSIYNMSGKLIERNSVNPMDIENARFGLNLSSGMYIIEVKQGSNQAVVRQVKN